MQIDSIQNKRRISAQSNENLGAHRVVDRGSEMHARFCLLLRVTPTLRSSWLDFGCTVSSLSFPLPNFHFFSCLTIHCSCFWFPLRGRSPRPRLRWGYRTLRSIRWVHPDFGLISWGNRWLPEPVMFLIRWSGSRRCTSSWRDISCGLLRLLLTINNFLLNWQDVGLWIYIHVEGEAMKPEWSYNISPRFAFC